MKINRGDLLFASGLSLLAGTRAFGQSTGATPPRTQQAIGKPFKYKENFK